MKKIFFILCLFITHEVFASAGQILFARGGVYVQKQGKSAKKRVKKGHEVSVGDFVSTDKGSIAVVKLNSGNKIKVNAKSAIKIESEKTKNKPDTVLLRRGSAFVSVLKSKLKSKIKDPVKFQLKTTRAAMGVRGTEFFASFGKVDDNKRKDLWMCVRTGLVEVSTTSSKKKVLVKEGEGVKIEEEKKISDPKPLEWTKELNWNMEAEKGDLENKVKIEEAYTDLLDKDYD